MKILQVLYSGLGGHGNVFFSFIKGSSTNGLSFEAIFNGIEAVKPEYIELCTEKQIPWHFVAKKPGLDLGYYRQLIKQIRKSDADVVFLHSSAYIMPAKLANLFAKKRKLIVVRETQANHLKVKMEWVWLFVAMLLAHRIVFLSEEYRQEIAKKLSLVYRSKKVAVIPNGLDLDLYKPAGPTRNPQLVVGMVSRLVRIKDHLTLLEAFAQLLHTGTNPQIILKIAGDGDYRQVLEDKAASLQLGNAVVFTGMLNEKELIGFLPTLDIYVHASYGETMSTAIMQAMACGLPLVASDVKGIHNMVQNGVTGILVPVQDAGAMAAAIQLYINDAAKRAAMGAAAREYAERCFSNESMINAYTELFVKSLKKNG